MKIFAEISYNKDGVLTFEPNKVLSRLKLYFPDMKTDLKDQIRIGLKNSSKL